MRHERAAMQEAHCEFVRVFEVFNNNLFPRQGELIWARKKSRTQKVTEDGEITCPDRRSKCPSGNRSAPDGLIKGTASVSFRKYLLSSCERQIRLLPSGGSELLRRPPALLSTWVQLRRIRTAMHSGEGEGQSPSRSASPHSKSVSALS